jgi:hypothetical protein
MPDQETIVQETAAEEWDEPVEDLPRRPRRRLLGAGVNPVPLALLGVLLIACGFIAGVLIEKGQSSTSSTAGSGAAGLASRFAALRGGGTSGTSAGGAATGGSSTGGAAAASGLFEGSRGAGGAGMTTGQVAYVSGSTLYVTNAEGNTVKVTTSPASTVTKTMKADVKGIHPGETVLITGAAGANGAISAESIRVGSTGGGLSALFGGAGGNSRSGGGGGGGAGAGASSGPALFGNGG